MWGLVQNVLACVDTGLEGLLTCIVGQSCDDSRSGDLMIMIRSISGDKKREHAFRVEDCNP